MISTGDSPQSSDSRELAGSTFYIHVIIYYGSDKYIISQRQYLNLRFDCAGANQGLISCCTGMINYFFHM